MSSAEIERRAVAKAFALRDALVAAKRFCVYGRNEDETIRVAAGVMQAVLVPRQGFLIMLEEMRVPISARNIIQAYLNMVDWRHIQTGGPQGDIKDWSTSPHFIQW
jgi:hypothetical protein